MKNATFYLPGPDPQQGTLSATEALACELAAARWREGKRILVACENEQQAIRLDEALWQRPAEAFVPHNLAGVNHEIDATYKLFKIWCLQT